MNFEKITEMTKFERLVHHYKKGEISERQWNSYLEDPIFSEYIKVRFGK